MRDHYIIEINKEAFHMTKRPVINVIGEDSAISHIATLAYNALAIEGMTAQAEEMVGRLNKDMLYMSKLRSHNSPWPERQPWCRAMRIIQKYVELGQ